MSLLIRKKHRCFDGEVLYFEHQSRMTQTKMNFSVFIPCQREELESALIWLSGLTCTEENFITKSGALKLLKDSKTMLICPDTSPRGLDLDKEHESYDFGSGAGFYLKATTAGYSKHYNMYDYVSKELLEIIEAEFSIKKYSISGHSMGGHGALILGLREKSLFKSVSAFSPIANPCQAPWGKKAFRGYLGDDERLWREFDSTELLKNGFIREDSILIDQGLDDEFLEEQLLTDNFFEAAKASGQKTSINYREGHDHSYFFISSFIHEHIDFHLKALS